MGNDVGTVNSTITSLLVTLLPENQHFANTSLDKHVKNFKQSKVSDSDAAEMKLHSILKLY